MANTKICSKCGKELPLSEFSKDKSRKDGLQLWCKECKKQHYARNRKARKQYYKQYYAEHIDERKQYDKQHYAEHRDKRIDKMRQYYATLEGYARNIRNGNLKKDRKYGRIGANEDPLPSIEQYIELLQQPDYYDGKQYHWTQMGLDRIDNSKPHTIDNIVPCTTEHNKQRGIKSFEEFCELMQKLF